MPRRTVHARRNNVFQPKLVNIMYAFAVGFNDLHLNDGEIGLFSAIVLLSKGEIKVAQNAHVRA